MPLKRVGEASQTAPHQSETAILATLNLPMASYSRATLRDFLNTSDSEVLAKLTLAYANSGFSRMHSDQPLTWWDDLVELRQALHALTTANPSSNDWQILLEFSIPRKER